MTKYHKGQFMKGYKGGFMESANQAIDTTYSKEDERIYEGCRGCSSHGVRYFRPLKGTHDFKWVYCAPIKETECPCSICVIKMMCKDSCQLYDKYRSHRIFERK